MSKKIMLIFLSVVCIAVLTACASVPANASAATSSVQPAAVSPSATLSDVQSEPPAPDAADADNAEAVSLNDAGITLEDIIKEGSLNKNLANDDSMKFPGENIEAAIEGNTLTFYVTLDQDIKEPDLTPELKKKYTAEMKSLIDTLDEQYEGFPDCTFVYILRNNSGDILMKLTQDYKEK